MQTQCNTQAAIRLVDVAIDITVELNAAISFESNDVVDHPTGL